MYQTSVAGLEQPLRRVAQPSPSVVAKPVDPSTMSEAEFLDYTLNAMRQGDATPIIIAELDVWRDIQDEHIGEFFARYSVGY